MYHTNRDKLDTVMDTLRNVIVNMRYDRVSYVDAEDVRKCISLIGEVYEDEVNGL